MQRPSPEKRQKIMDCAARLFAARPFHEVRLDEVAAAAHIGKGTVYIYFKGKVELYASLIEDGFSRLVRELKNEVAGEPSPDAALGRIVRRLVQFALAHPECFELLRASVPAEQHRGLQQVRRELGDLIAKILRRGVRDAIWTDPRPALTAIFIPGLVRSAMIYGPRKLGEKALVSHILRLLRDGLIRRETR